MGGHRPKKPIYHSDYKVNTLDVNPWKNYFDLITYRNHRRAEEHSHSPFPDEELLSIYSDSTDSYSGGETRLLRNKDSPSEYPPSKTNLHRQHRTPSRRSNETAADLAIEKTSPIDNATASEYRSSVRRGTRRQKDDALEEGVGRSRPVSPFFTYGLKTNCGNGDVAERRTHNVNAADQVAESALRAQYLRTSLHKRNNRQRQQRRHRSISQSNPDDTSHSYERPTSSSLSRRRLFQDKLNRGGARRAAADNSQWRTDDTHEQPRHVTTSDSTSLAASPSSGGRQRHQLQHKYQDSQTRRDMSSAADTKARRLHGFNYRRRCHHRSISTRPGSFHKASPNRPCRRTVAATKSAACSSSSPTTARDLRSSCIACQRQDRLGREHPVNPDQQLYYDLFSQRNSASTRKWKSEYEKQFVAYDPEVYRQIRLDSIQANSARPARQFFVPL